MAEMITAPIGPDSPLRLDAAAVFAFPDGSMTVAGLRRERDRGRLATFRAAGKEYTTPRDLERMIQLCRTQPRERASTFAPPAEIDEPSGSFETETRSKALDALLMKLDRPSSGSRNTSRRSTSRTGKASVIPLRSK